jgi:hypothetical protein
MGKAETCMNIVEFFLLAVSNKTERSTATNTQDAVNTKKYTRKAAILVDIVSCCMDTRRS